MSQAALQQAYLAFQRGRLLDAKVSCESVLKKNPSNFDALHLMGLLAFKQGNADQSITFLSKAVKFNSKSSAAFFNLASVLANVDRNSEAIDALRPAIKLQPDYLEARTMRGILLSRAERYEEALPDLTRSVELNPNNADVQNALGIALFELNRYEEGSACCEKAVELNSQFSEAHNNLARMFLFLQRYEKVLEHSARAIMLDPNLAEAYYHRGIALTSLNRSGDACSDFARAISLNPVFAEAHVGYANALGRLGKFEEAIAASDQAIGLRPDSVDARISRSTILKSLVRFDEALDNLDLAAALAPNNADINCHRGAVLNEMNRLDEALECEHRALEIRPDFAEAYSNLGLILTGLNRLDEALENFDKAIALKPDLKGARFHRANLLMLQGDLERGLVDYELRAPEQDSDAIAYSRPVWLGREDIAGKTLFVYPELYLGDMIHFVRYAKLAEARGARVIISTKPSMHRLLGTMSSTIEFLPLNTEPPVYDFCCPLMSLPLAFNTRIESIPADVPYLSPEPERVAAWLRTLGPEGFKIGICWQGSTLAYAAPMRRSFPVTMFERISRIAGVRLISLQKVDGLDQLADLPEGMKVETLGSDFDSGPDAFLDTAAVMQSMDLIITTDTAIAHLAGALGRPTWVALKQVPDWRWFLGRDDSPWYPEMRLFRQAARGDWTGVFSDIEAALPSAMTPDH